jgi:hypothetical protein
MLGEHLCALLQQDLDGGNLWRSHGPWLVGELLQVVGLPQIVDGVLQRFEHDALLRRELPPRCAQSKIARSCFRHAQHGNVPGGVADWL